MTWSRTALSLLGLLFLFLSTSAWAIAKVGIFLHKPLLLIGSTYALSVALSWLTAIGLIVMAIALSHDLLAQRRSNRALQARILALKP